jgi:CubicO group peptidase (beta-lactamase class C family)
MIHQNGLPEHKDRTGRQFSKPQGSYMSNVIFFVRNIFTLIILIGILGLNLVIGESDTKKIDQLIRAYHENGEFNGCVLVAQKGKVIYKKAFGYADYTVSESLTTKYQFRLASVSKQFTAMAIMILKERNKLEYDDPIVHYLSEFPYIDVTVRHLLTNLSGLPEYGDLFEREKESGGFIKHVISNSDVYDLIDK